MNEHADRDRSEAPCACPPLGYSSTCSTHGAFLCAPAPLAGAGTPQSAPERYAEVIDNLTNHLVTDWPQWLEDVASAVAAVADAEQADLRAEVKQLRVDVQYLNDRLADRRDQAEAAEAKVAQVEALHVDTGEGWCGACGRNWPCPTRAALDGGQ